MGLVIEHVIMHVHNVKEISDCAVIAMERKLSICVQTTVKVDFKLNFYHHVRVEL